LQAVVHEREQIVGDDAFKGIAIQKTKTKPEAVKLGAAEEGFALGLEIAIEIANKIDGADFGQQEFLVLAIWREQVDRINLT